MADPNDLHDNSPAAVAARRAYFARRGARKARSSAPRMPRVMPDIGRAARHPVKYMKEDRVPAALLLFLILVAIAVLRRGALPDGRGWIAIAGSAGVLVVVASVAPDVVTWVLLVAVVVSVIQHRAVVTQVIDLGAARVRAAFAPAGF